MKYSLLRLLLTSMLLLLFCACHKRVNAPNLGTQSGSGTNPDDTETPAEPGSADGLLLSGPASFTANTCQLFLIRPLQGEIVVSVTEPLDVTLQQSGYGTFYSDALCTAPISQVHLPQGTDRKKIYFRDPRGERVYLTLNSDGLTSYTLEVEISGLASLYFAGDSTYDFGWTGVGLSNSHVITLRNSGNGPATSLEESLPLLAPPFSFTGGTYPGANGNCTDVLPIGTECRLDISFSPISTGSFSETLSLQFFDGTSSNTVELPLEGYSTESGQLDASFNSTGTQTFGFGPGGTSSENDYIYQVKLQEDGSLVGVGATYQSASSSFDIAVMRLTPSGALDSTFGTDGKVSIDLGSNDFGKSLSLLADGKILVGGYGTVSGTTRFLVIRLLSDGTLDPNFGTGGITSTAFPRAAQGVALAVQNDGKILLAGNVSTASGRTSYAVVRYLESGAIDTDFASSGKFTHAFTGQNLNYATAIQVDESGLIFIGGYSGRTSLYQMSSLRLLSNGSLDTAYGDQGTTLLSLGASNTANAMIFNGSGIILAGTYGFGSSNSDALLVRYSFDGVLDDQFATNGTSIADLRSATDALTSLETDSHGRILAGGYSSHFVMVRFQATGQLDTNFGSSGMVTTSFGSGISQLNSFALDPLGRILVGGSAWNGTNYDFAFARYWP